MIHVTMSINEAKAVIAALENAGEKGILAVLRNNLKARIA